MALGVCVSPACMPGYDEVGMLNPPVVKSIVYGFGEFDEAISGSLGGRRVIALLNSESEGVGGDYGGWRDAVEQFAGRFAGRVEAVECINEWDLLGLPHDLVIGAVREASPILRGAGIRCLLGSVAGSNWPSDLEEVAAECGDAIDGVCLHPYGQRSVGFPSRIKASMRSGVQMGPVTIYSARDVSPIPPPASRQVGRRGWGFGEMSDAIMTAYNSSGGHPVYLTEFGIKIGDAGGEVEQAIYLNLAHEVIEGVGPDICPVACVFAWKDEVGMPHERGYHAFGLMADDGRRRPAWETVVSINAGYVVAPEPPPDPPAVGPIGDGLQRELDRRGWTPTTSEHLTSWPVVFAKTGDGQDAIVMWSGNEAIAYRRAG